MIQADVERRCGDDEKARARLKEALEAMSGPEAFEEVRWHYCNRQSHRELTAFVRQLTASLPSCAWGHWILARLLSVLDDHAAAAAEADRTVGLAPDLRQSLKADPCLRGIEDL